jgi:hypothetical protein
MALQHLRSSTADKRPTPASMSDGQLALNTNLVSPGLFFKDSNGDSVKIGPVHVGTTAPNVTPGAGGQAGNSKGEAWLDTTAANPILKVWNGSAFVAVQPVGTGTVVSTTDTGTVTSTMLADGTIVDADVNASAAIVDTKLATISTAGKVSGTAITSGAINTSGDLNITNAAPTIRLTDSDGTATHNQAHLVRGSDNFQIQTRSSADVFLSSDYIISADASGATDHVWRIANIEKARLDSTGLTVVNDLTISDKIIHAGDTNTAIRFPAADTVTVETGGSEKVRIDSNGRLIRGNTASINTVNLGGNTIAPAVQQHAVDQANATFAATNWQDSSTASYLVLGKSRGGAVGTHGAVSVNSTIGFVNFAASDGTTFGSAAWMGCYAAATTSAGSTPGFLAFATSDAGATSPTERLRITSAGRVGIGTTSPATALEVNGDVTISDKIIHDGDTDTAIRFPAADTVTVETGGSEKVRIDSSGRLLVGPAASSIPTLGTDGGLQLHNVSNSNGAQLSIIRFNVDEGGGTLVIGKSKSATVAAGAVVADNDSLGTIYFVGDDGTDLGSSGARISCQVDGTPGANDMPGRLVFSTTADGASTSTERMRIRSNGDTYFGNTGGALANGDEGNLFLGASGEKRSYRSGTTSRTHYGFYNNNGLIGTITTSASATAYNTSSDYRLKENITLLDGAIARLGQLPVHRFNFIADPDTVVDGFIAHEAQEVVPECVTGTKDEVDDDGNPVMQGIDQSKLVPLLTAALQEAIAKIDALEARIAALEA